MQDSRLITRLPGRLPLSHSTRLRASSSRLRDVLQYDLPLRIILTLALLTRAAIAATWIWLESFEAGDVLYYWQRTNTLPELGMGQSLLEYPTPMAWMLTWPQTLGGGDRPAYVFWFVTLILLADIAFCVVLWRSAAAYRGWAIVCWSVFLMAIGPLVWLRFDLLPAVLVGAAVVLAVRWPAVAGGLLALGTAVKLWPLVLFPLLLNRPGNNRSVHNRSGTEPLSWVGRRGWSAPLLGFGAVGVVVVAASLLAGGWDRLVSPLRWQADRGLQIESIPASALMVLHAMDPSTWHVTISRYQAFEIFGPGVSEWLVVADVLGVLGVLAGLALLVRHLIGPVRALEDWAQGVAATMLAVIGLVIVVNKTLSPQYIVWLGGPLIALVAWLGPGHRILGRWLATVLAIAVLSHVVYPELYDRINGMALDPVWTPVATVLLVLRNLLLVAFTIDAGIVAWRTPRLIRPPH
jgi:hypothetical protein